MPDSIRVMVVDDDPAMCEFLTEFLGRRGYKTESVQTADEAVPTVRDVATGGGHPRSRDARRHGWTRGARGVPEIDRTVPILVLSGQGRTTTVVQAMKLGAIDFVSKPFEEADLEAPLLSALRQRQLCREVAQLREQLQGEARHTLLYGRSERMVHIRELIDRVAETDLPVLIRGERGTGKELVARAIYGESRRCDRPFVKVNCTGLPADVLESELFGFERGAFSGAMQHRPGKFEFANQGTLFLDELGDNRPVIAGQAAARAAGRGVLAPRRTRPTFT